MPPNLLHLSQHRFVEESSKLLVPCYATAVLHICASVFAISDQNGMVRPASDHAEAASYPFRRGRPPEGKYVSRPMHGGEEQSRYENKVIHEEAEFSLVAGPTVRTME